MPEKGRRGRARKSDLPIVSGLTPAPFRNEVGYRVIAPEELLSLRIPIVHRGKEKITDYQRKLSIGHATSIAWAMLEGKDVPNIQISLDEKGDAYCTDGQHRAVAAIIARQPIDAVVAQRSYHSAHQLFADQALAKKPTANHLILTGTDRMARYVQDALTQTNHPWHNLVHETHKQKLQPSTMHRLVTMYGCDVIGALTADKVRKVAARFDTDRADELAELIGVFGKDAHGEFRKDNNHAAFKQTNLSALCQAAVYTLIRAEDIHPGADKARWMTHMPDFNWIKFGYIRDQKAMTEQLLDHWNKKKTARRVTRRIYNRIDS